MIAGSPNGIALRQAYPAITQDFFGRRCGADRLFLPPGRPFALFSPGRGCPGGALLFGRDFFSGQGNAPFIVGGDRDLTVSP